MVALQRVLAPTPKARTALALQQQLAKMQERYLVQDSCGLKLVGFCTWALQQVKE